MRVNNRWTATVGIAGVLVLSACSSDDSAAQETAPSTSSAAAAGPAETVTPTPTPTPISKEQAGAAYLEMVAPANALTAQWNDAVNASDWATVRTLAQTYADTDRAFADALMSAQWPPEAQSAVDGLVAELAGEIAAFAQIAGTSADDETIGALNTFPARGSSAQQLRMTLGLDNVASS